MSVVSTGDEIEVDAMGIRMTFRVVLEPAPHAEFVGAFTSLGSIPVEVPTDMIPQFEAVANRQLSNLLLPAEGNVQ